MKRYLIPIVALIIGVGMMGGDVERKPANETTNLIYTNSVVFDKMAVGTNAQEYLDAARYFKVVTNLVDLIAASGEWCNVRGHDWRDIVGYGSDRWNQICVICWQRRDKPVPAPWSGWTTNNLWMTNYVIPLAR